MTKNASPSAESAEWRVGVGVRAITPPDPIILYGYACDRRFRPSIGVLDDLYARAVAFEDSAGARSVLVSLDLCVLRKPLAERFAAVAAEAGGFPRERVLINVSHTHSGPALDQPDIVGRFPIGKDEWRVISAYTESLPRRVAEAVSEAAASLAPARLSWSRGRTGIMRNRRVLDERGVWTGMGPYEPGPTDTSVPVLKAESPGGELRAVLFGCACHNVTLGPENLLVSSDYAGYARETIERAHPGATAIYLAGCGADANTEPRGGPRQWVHVREHGRTLGKEINRMLCEEAFRPVGGPLTTVLCDADLPLLHELSREELAARAEGPEWLRLNAQNMLQALERGEPLPETYSAPLGLWRFGNDLNLLAISGEVTCGYAFRAAEVLPAGRLWVLGYSHEVFGYLPTAKIIEEGGYEIRGLLLPGIGYFAPEVEDTVVSAISRLAESG